MCSSVVRVVETQTGQHLKLTANDGHELGAYRVDPEGPALGGVVVLQEIFGVNEHIHAVCDRLAAKAIGQSLPPCSTGSSVIFSRATHPTK
jgi:hypothetical protein